MNPKHLFFGILLLSVGALFFIEAISPIHLDWDLILKLWPVILILLGISALTIQPDAKAIILALSAIFLAFIILAFVRHDNFSVNEFFREDRSLPANEV
jgi:hypothetical protein